VSGRDKDPGGEDGGRTHEVGLATGLSEEQGGQPGEAAIVRGRGSFTVLVRPDYTASPGTLVGPVAVQPATTLSLVLIDHKLGRGLCWSPRCCCCRSCRGGSCPSIRILAGEVVVVK